MSISIPKRHPRGSLATPHTLSYYLWSFARNHSYVMRATATLLGANSLLQKHVLILPHHTALSFLLLCHLTKVIHRLIVFLNEAESVLRHRLLEHE